jgi:hypothetical protein
MPTGPICTLIRLKNQKIYIYASMVHSGQHIRDWRKIQLIYSENSNSYLSPCYTIMKIIPKPLMNTFLWSKLQNHYLICKNVYFTCKIQHISCHLGVSRIFK